MMTIRIRGQLCALTLAVFLPALVKADVIFSDFGPGNTYDCCLNWGIGTPFPSFTTISAMAFTPSSNFDLSQIDLAITWLGNTKSVIISLENSSGGLPGAAVESWTLSNFQPIETITPVSTVELLAGQEYWIAAAPGASDTLAIWNWNAVGATGAYAQSIGGGSFIRNNGTLGAFDVLGTPVPEPSSILLLGTVFFGLMLIWRRTARARS